MAERAVGLFETLGYTNANHYRGGIEDWRKHGGDFEGSDSSRNTSDGDWSARVLGIVDRISFRRWLGIWGVMVVMCGVIFWQAPYGTLVVQGEPLSPAARNLGQAIYFSGVTATTLGFGDITPTGALRVLAILEAAAGMLLFGAVVTKLLSRRQEQLIQDIHDLSFEERLGRIHHGLHSLIGETHAIRGLARDADCKERLGRRIDSAVRMFALELRRVHRLLYRPQSDVDEDVLESILASLVSTLGEFEDMLTSLGDYEHNQAHDASLRSIVRTAEEICAECIPVRRAPRLARWMDAVQEAARGITV